MTPVFEAWKDSLSRVLQYYDTNRGSLLTFFPKLFLFFVLVNILFYWWAMFTAFPQLTVGGAGIHYFKVQFPVGFLGALFDSLSFFVTIYIIRRALRSRSPVEYVSHLSVDLFIAILATFWVVFVFSFSGWLISLVDAAPQSLTARNDRYEQMVVDAVARPTQNLRNIYFGLIMGISALIPTLTHVFMFLRASFCNVTLSNRGGTF